MRYTDRMKTAAFILSAVGVGLLLGGGTALVRMRLNAWDGNPGARPLSAPKAAPAGRGLPKLAVDAEEFDFGTMDAAEERSHQFVVRNTVRRPPGTDRRPHLLPLHRGHVGHRRDSRPAAPPRSK